MPKSNKIKVMYCPECDEERKTDSKYCNKHFQEKGSVRLQQIEREKIQVSSEFWVVDWFSGRESAGLILQDITGRRYPMYMSDIFKYLDGTNLGVLKIEETKKGTAYGWKVVSE